MAKSPLKYERDNYNPAYLRNNLDIKDMRKEYSRLRGIANKRLNAIKNYYAESKIYNKYKDEFTKLSDISDRELPYKLTKVANFLSRRLSSVTEIKRYERESLEQLHKDGYTFITRTNLHDFFDFMDDTRTAAKNSRYDSDRVVNLWEIGERKNIPPEVLKSDFDYWIENRNKLENITIPEDMEVITSDGLKELIRRAEKSRRNKG